MALNLRGAIDARWLTHHNNVVRSFQLAKVEIYNPASGSQEYDADNNNWTGSVAKKYVGRARVQPVNAVSEIADNYNPTFIKTVRVQISYNKNELAGGTNPMPDIRPNDRMKVTSSPYNTSLTKFVYIVTDVLNSSNAWERTLLCKVDTELDPTVV